MAEELTEHCKRRLAGFKVPEVVHLVGELPLDQQGKIIKRGLRALRG